MRITLKNPEACSYSQHFFREKKMHTLTIDVPKLFYAAIVLFNTWV